MQNLALLKYKPARIAHKTLVNMWKKVISKAGKRRGHVLLFNPTLKPVELNISIANKVRDDEAGGDAASHSPSWLPGQSVTPVDKC